MGFVFLMGTVPFLTCPVFCFSQGVCFDVPAAKVKEIQVWRCACVFGVVCKATLEGRVCTNVQLIPVSQATHCSRVSLMEACQQTRVLLLFADSACFCLSAGAMAQRPALAAHRRYRAPRDGAERVSRRRTDVWRIRRPRRTVVWRIRRPRRTVVWWIRRPWWTRTLVRLQRQQRFRR